MSYIGIYGKRCIPPKIEETAGIKETLFHAVMGVQIGIPIFLGLLFEINYEYERSINSLQFDQTLALRIGRIVGDTRIVHGTSACLPGKIAN